MRRFSILVSSLSLVLAMSALVSAQDESAQDVSAQDVAAQDDAQRPSRESAALFDQLDANNDGALTQDEVPDRRQRLFTRLLNRSDKDKDGKLTRDEFAAGLQDSPSDRRGADQDSADGPARPTNGPARSADRPREARGPIVPAFFARLDANSDGKITKDEIPEASPLRQRISAMLTRFDRNDDGALSRDELAASRDQAPDRDSATPGGSRAPADGRPATPGRGPANRPGPPMMSGAAVVRALDADGNGTISASEIEGAAAALKKLDRNSDGQLSREEQGRGGFPGGALPGGAGMLERLRELDKNNDGKNSKDELPPRLRERFEALDSDKDGFLDREELRSFGSQDRRGDGPDTRRGPPDRSGQPGNR